MRSVFRSSAFLLKRFSKRVPKDKSCDDVSMKILRGVYGSYNTYIEFSDVLSFAESSFEEGEAEYWEALRNSVPFRRGVNLGLFSENPRCILLFGRELSLVAVN